MNIKTKTNFSSQDSNEEIFQKVLENRGLKTKNQIKTFTHPPYPTKNLLQKALKIKQTDLDLVTQLIQKAIQESQDICIFGDYDADGITSTAILWKTLNHLKARALPFIPHRKKHGYGISKSAIKEILSGKSFKNSPLSPFKPQLFITTDNGIVANEAIQYLKDQGISVILTDHHKKSKTLPKADAIIHSTETAAAGIAWLLSLALTDSSAFSKNLLEFATIGIVADQMSLRGINRTITVHGLKSLNSPQSLGLKKLYSTAGIKNHTISTYDIGFVLGPRINAMGRLKHGLDALRLLCTKSAQTAQNLSLLLEKTNKNRQIMTDKALKHAQENLVKNKLQIVASDAYHEGIVGLIAGKLVEETGKPSLAISLNKNIAKGSARSIKGINITDLLRSQEDLLESVGGHEFAAGFSLKPENLEKFTKNIQKQAEKEITKEILTRSISVEGELNLTQTSKELSQKLSLLSPFGLGNPKPRFLSRGIQILSSRKVGKTGNHLKMVLGQGNVNKQAIWFNASPLKGKTISELIYTIDINVWRNKESLQLTVKHAK